VLTRSIIFLLSQKLVKKLYSCLFQSVLISDIIVFNTSFEKRRSTCYMKGSEIKETSAILTKQK